MSTFFPSYNITGIRPSRWYAAPRDWKQITEEFEYEDGGKDFNETADDAPRRWEYGHNGLTPEQTTQFDEFFDLVRHTQPFIFIDKFGVAWDNVFVESYSRTHEAHKSWNITVLFRLVGYGSSIVDITPPTPPTDLEIVDVGSDFVEFDFTPGTD